MILLQFCDARAGAAELPLHQGPLKCDHLAQDTCPCSWGHITPQCPPTLSPAAQGPHEPMQGAERAANLHGRAKGKPQEMHSAGINQISLIINL